MIEKLPEEYESFCAGTTKINELIDAVNKLTEKKEEWKDGEEGFYIRGDGAIVSTIYNGGYVDKAIQSYTGMYHTQKEAGAVVEKIREFVKTL